MLLWGWEKKQCESGFKVVLPRRDKLCGLYGKLLYGTLIKFFVLFYFISQRKTFLPLLFLSAKRVKSTPHVQKKIKPRYANLAKGVSTLLVFCHKWWMMPDKSVRRFRRCAGRQQSIFKLGNLMYFNELISVDYRTDFDFELHLLLCLAVTDRCFNSPNLSPVKQSSIGCLSCNQEKPVCRHAKHLATVWSPVPSHMFPRSCRSEPSRGAVSTEPQKVPSRSQPCLPFEPLIPPPNRMLSSLRQATGIFWSVVS